MEEVYRLMEAAAVVLVLLHRIASFGTLLRLERVAQHQPVRRLELLIMARKVSINRLCLQWLLKFCALLTNVIVAD